MHWMSSDVMSEASAGRVSKEANGSGVNRADFTQPCSFYRPSDSILEHLLPVRSNSRIWAGRWCPGCPPPPGAMTMRSRPRSGGATRLGAASATLKAACHSEKGRGVGVVPSRWPRLTSADDPIQLREQRVTAERLDDEVARANCLAALDALARRLAGQHDDRRGDAREH